MQKRTNVKEQCTKISRLLLDNIYFFKIIYEMIGDEGKYVVILDNLIKNNKIAFNEINEVRKKIAGID